MRSPVIRHPATAREPAGNRSLEDKGHPAPARRRLLLTCRGVCAQPDPSPPSGAANPPARHTRHTSRFQNRPRPEAFHCQAARLPQPRSPDRGPVLEDARGTRLPRRTLARLRVPANHPDGTRGHTPGGHPACPRPPRPPGNPTGTAPPGARRRPPSRRHARCWGRTIRHAVAGRSSTPDIAAGQPSNSHGRIRTLPGAQAAGAYRAPSPTSPPGPSEPSGPAGAVLGDRCPRHVIPVKPASTLMSSARIRRLREPGRRAEVPHHFTHQ